MDDQQSCATGFINSYNSPNKNGMNKNFDKNSPSKISPNKQVQGTGKHTDGSNNGQVMTQISAIYAKRSKSILNQFG